MKDLPALYAAVTAKRPELAVNADDGPWTLAHDGTDWDWTYHAVDDDYSWRCQEMPDRFAAALILARWVEALPKYHVLAHVVEWPGIGQWLVYEMGTGGDYTDPGRDSSATPIEALAAFYLGEQ